VEQYGARTKIYYETRYNPILNKNSEIIGVTILSADISERKRAETALLELNKELQSFSYL
jgi:hypothetical protein